jgi:hypothetical protein
MKCNGCFALGLGTLLLCGQAVAQVVVYDDLAPSSWSAAYPVNVSAPANGSMSDEIGDEIDLAPGTSRNLSSFTFQYFAQNLASTDEVRVRMYANTGPLSPQGAPTPQDPPLYDSGNLPVNLLNGRGSMTLNNLNVTVPDTIVWTIQFTGLTDPNPAAPGTSKVAGLAISGDPSPGFSFDDYWEKTTTGWNLYQLGTPYTSNFGAQLTASAVPEPAATAAVMLSTALLSVVTLRRVRRRQAQA